jgi:mannosyltransferase OCH1-like enzyme
MYRLGGLYLDTDYEMLKSFDLCQKDIVLCWEPNPTKPKENGKMANAIFASSPEHPFWGMIIEELKVNPPLSADADVEATTGPGLVTRVYEKAIQGGMSLFATSPQLFSPLTPRNEKEYRTIVQSGVAYGIHHCHGSWRKFTMYQRFINFASRSYHRVKQS